VAKLITIFHKMRISPRRLRLARRPSAVSRKRVGRLPGFETEAKAISIGKRILRSESILRVARNVLPQTTRLVYGEINDSGHRGERPYPAPGGDPSEEESVLDLSWRAFIAVESAVQSLRVAMGSVPELAALEYATGCDSTWI